MTIQEQLKKEFPNLETDSHESDLYIKHTPEVWEFLKSNYEYFCNCSKFHSQTDHELWIDLPFAYDNFWAKKGMLK